MALAQPFCDIFVDRQEAEWAFDLMARAASRLLVADPVDERLTVSLRYINRAIHMSFNDWLILGFYGAGFKDYRVAIAFRDRTAYFPDASSAVFYSKGDGRATRLYFLPMEALRPMSEPLARSYITTLEHVKNHFEGQARNPFRRSHVPELARALFDTDYRERLLESGLALDDTFTSSGAYSVYPIAQMAEDTGFDEDLLAGWVAAIERKGQAILCGPSGTGKTFMAQRLARHLVGGGDGLIETVQFHPGYTYDDFVRGTQPQTLEDGIRYPSLAGRFRQFCRAATSRFGRSVMVIDEINRADPSTVFGELLYLLENRDREIRLAGGEILRVPDNIRIIGAMSTADPQAAITDSVFRRRFAFLTVRPDYDVLRRYHAREMTGFEPKGLIETLGKLNAAIADPDREVGITYFLRPDLHDHVSDIWQTEIEPYLLQFFSDRSELLERFTWSKVRSKVAGRSRRVTRR